MDDGGRDIAPGEERLNYVYNGNHDNDLVEDRVMEHDHSENSVSDSIRSRAGFDIQEPVDTTPDAVGTIYRHVFPEQRQSASNAPNYYKSEENRLSTFADWRFQSVVRKEDLAKNGFIYTGTGDKVRCIYCNGVLRQWDRDDVVELEHRRCYSTCPLLTGQDVGNVPLQPGNTATWMTVDTTAANTTTTSRPVRAMNGGHDIDPTEERYGASCLNPVTLCRSISHEHDAVSSSRNGSESSAGRRAYSNAPRNPHMAVEPERLATFSNWPAQMKQKPSQLAQAGLYYTGDGDKVKCFHCDGLLHRWDPEDDPYMEHARWFPNCQYIQLVKGDTFVDDVQNGRETLDQVMHTPAVEAVLYEGHSEASVQRALASMRQNNGANVVVSAQNLLLTIMELEGDVTENTKQNGEASSEDVKKLQRENETLRDKQLCKICMERDVDVIFLPCKHLVCCAPCSAAVRSCPICRMAIESINKIFMV